MRPRPGEVLHFSEDHEAAGIQLRVMGNLWGWWKAEISSSLGYSRIRMGNAKPAP